MCAGVGAFDETQAAEKLQIPKPKSQINSKLQIPTGRVFLARPQKQPRVSAGFTFR